MNNKVLLTVGIGLLLLGFFQPKLSFPINNPDNNSIVVITPPQDVQLRDKCKLVVDILENGSGDRKQDGARLADLYMDLSTLIELDGDNEVIKTTEELRQANSLSGPMLRMNIKVNIRD
jgi:hypothetical protein